MTPLDRINAYTAHRMGIMTKEERDVRLADIDGQIERHLSANEAGTILALKKLSETWPERYWLWAADGKLYLMAKDADGKRSMTSNGSVDPSYMVRALNIPADGGDW